MLKALAATFLLSAALAASAAEIKFDLSRTNDSGLPDGFATPPSAPGKPGGWKIVDEIIPRILAPLSTNVPTPTAKHSVLAQTSTVDANGRAAVLLYTNENLKNFTLTTRIKVVTGGAEPAAGVVFRAQDESNYYVIRASTAGNLLWYRVVGGVRYETTGIGVLVPVPAQTWMDLKVECDGSYIRAFLNGKLMIPPAKPGAPTDDVHVNDTTFATGSIGFWTGAGTVAYFSDTRVNYTPRVPIVQSVVTDVMKRYPRLLGLKVYAAKDSAAPVLIADAKEQGLGTPGGKTEQDVIGKGLIMYAKDSGWVEVTLPLRDRNGDVVAAVKTKMDAFKGETADTAVARATVIKKAIEDRLDTIEDINE